MNSLNADFILEEIMKKLPPEDVLSFSKTNKYYHKLVFDNLSYITETFSFKYNLMKCIRKMIRFISKGEMSQAIWGFSYKNTITISFIRTDKKHFVRINNQSVDYMSEEKIMEYLKSNIIPKWENIVLHTGCWYNNKIKRQEYHDITSVMVKLLKKTVVP